VQPLCLEEERRRHAGGNRKLYNNNIIIITWIYIVPFKKPKALYKLGRLRKGRKEKGIIIIIKEQKEK